MTTETITINVSPQVATAYRTASEEERRKLELMVNLQLTEFLGSTLTLEQAIDQVSREAAASGLTPEVLDSILHDV